MVVDHTRESLGTWPSDVRDVQAILEALSEMDFVEVSISVGDFSLTVNRDTEEPGTPAAEPWTPDRTGTAPQAAQSSSTTPPADQLESVQPDVGQAAASGFGDESSTAGARAKEVDAEGEGTTSGALTIRAPMLGTFYRRPEPGKPAYVEVGDEVAADQPLCLVETMKLFNTVQSPVAGQVTRILVNDGDVVEHDQPLIEIAPLGASRAEDSSQGMTTE